jgi:hypothetical protein
MRDKSCIEKSTKHTRIRTEVVWYMIVFLYGLWIPRVPALNTVFNTVLSLKH